MPVIQEQSPLAAAAQSAGAVLNANYARQLQERDYLLRKAGVDAQVAANKSRANYENAQITDQRTLNGLDENGKPIKMNVPDVSPGASLQDQYNNTILRANAYQKAGASKAAAPLYAQADRIQTQIHYAKQDAIAYMREADAHLKIIAQEQHWSAQEKEVARHNLAEEAIKIRNGTLTYNAAMARVGATIRAAQIHAGASEYSAQLMHQDRAAERKVQMRGQDMLLKRAGLTGSLGGALTNQIINEMQQAMITKGGGAAGYAAAAAQISSNPKLNPLQKRAALQYLRELRLSSAQAIGQAPQ